MSPKHPDLALEDRLRRELARRATATPTSPTARADIHRRATAAAAASDPPRWRRPAAALAVMVVLVVAAVRVIDRGSDETQTPPVVHPLPARPPTLAGGVLGAVMVPCTADQGTDPTCGGGPGSLDLARPDQVNLLARETALYDTASPILSDGRLVESDPGLDPGATVIDPASERSLRLEAHDSTTPTAALPDGRVAIVHGSATGPDRLDIVGEDGVESSIALPSDLNTAALAAGPEGWLAVLGDGDRECCLNRAELVLVAPGGALHRVGIRDAVADRDPTMTGLVMSWGSRGLIALSGTRLAPPGSDRFFDWTVVVDPTTGERVAALDAQGIAWAPDGTGLLASRRTGRTSSELTLFWGPGLRQETGVGPVPGEFTPYWWQP